MCVCVQDERTIRTRMNSKVFEEFSRHCIEKKKTSNESNLIAANVYSITENHDAEEVNTVLASWR